MESWLSTSHHRCRRFSFHGALMLLRGQDGEGACLLREAGRANLRASVGLQEGFPATSSRDRGGWGELGCVRKHSFLLSHPSVHAVLFHRNLIPASHLEQRLPECVPRIPAPAPPHLQPEQLHVYSFDTLRLPVAQLGLGCKQKKPTSLTKEKRSVLEAEANQRSVGREAQETGS